ncbi:MAG: DNA (cytosine-5-)-methyltransferase [Spiroplasma ixodetis]|nr:DNA (cytosine-5-)-methyltransferase [Spiroplasma ixodetis]
MKKTQNISENNNKRKENFTFVDLFSGIGGFHQALESLGGKCVAASEINSSCNETYKKNFPQTPILGDIKKEWTKLPKFDILCAGFPCQPFSKAGKQNGFNDKEHGKLFDVIIDILKNHKECKFVILENVRNLSDKLTNWQIIQEKLKQLDFFVTKKPVILSPSQFKIPQIRERVYILGIKKKIRNPKKLSNGFIHLEELGLTNIPSALKSLNNGDAWNILEPNPDKKYFLLKPENEILNIWDEFRKGTNYEQSNVPIWIDYFGYKLSDSEFNSKKFYQTKYKTNKQISELPEWKKKFAIKNRNFYLKHKEFIDKWIEKYNMLNKKSIHKKFEWNCGNDFESLKDTIIQFRHSGIRAKRPNYFPTLVALNNTPILWDKELKNFRYITPREAANLQSFKKEYKFSENDSKTYKQLGNAVNVYIIQILASKLINFALDNWKEMEIK